MPEVDEEFHHEIAVWTVGDLKKALADIADDTELIFSTAEEPGSDLAGPEQIAYSAGTSTFYDSGVRERYPAFEVSLEFPSGAYYRRVWKDDEPDASASAPPGALRAAAEDGSPALPARPT